MTRCTAIRQLLEERSLGTLSAEEARAVDEHVRSCAGCAAGLRAMGVVSARKQQALALPDSYRATILPRVRERLEGRSELRLPAFVLRVLSPAAAALFLFVVALQLVPSGGGGAPADALAILQELPEEELAAVAEGHDSQAILSLPADRTEVATPDIDEDTLLEELVDGVSSSELAEYLDVDLAVEGLGDEEQSQLISMLNQESLQSSGKDNP